MNDPANIFWAWAAFAFVFGTLIGSFLNVVIYRVPAGLSVVKPASRCPACETPIRWYDNIPIVSWLVLRGKCRACKSEIPWRYAGVEALTGVLSAAVFYQQFGGMLRATALPAEEVLLGSFLIYLLHFAFVALLVAIAFVDLDHYLIPHEFTVPGIALGLAAPWIIDAALSERAMLYVWPPVTPWMSLAGALGGYLAIIAIFYLYLAVRGVEGMGGGDATLMALVGAWLGLPALVFVLFAASLQGLIAAGLSVLFWVEFVRDSTEIFVDEEKPEPADDAASAEPEAEATEEGLGRGALPPREEVGGGALPPREDTVVETGRAAVPFGPFISLAAAEFLLLGPYLPPELNFIYLYM